MSIAASVDISLLNNSNYNYSILDLIDAMINNNWTISNGEKTSYLPLGDDDLFEWTDSALTENQLREIVTLKEVAKETVGIVFYWKNTNIGITLLMFQDKNITFNLNINRVIFDSLEHMKITDVNWYLKRIIPCLNSERFKIRDIKFTQEW